MHKNCSHNLQHHLLLRESNLTPGRRHPIPHWFRFHERNFYRSITPRLSVLHVHQPSCHLQKFTPDGQMLIAFSTDFKSLEVFQYLGVGSVACLLGQTDDECITTTDPSLLSLSIRQELFNSLFKKKFNIPIVNSISNSRELLHPKFRLFLENGSFVLLASFDECFRNHNPRDHFQYPEMANITLYDIRFHLVDLKNGCIVDTLKLENDFVQLSYHRNVSLYERTLAILSTYRQSIDIVEVNLTLGKLRRLFTLGPFGSDRDTELLTPHLAMWNTNNQFPISHLRQKVLAFQYRQIMKVDSASERTRQLNEFYKEFPKVEHMLIDKMQLINSDYLLLRYVRYRDRLADGNFLFDNEDIIYFVFYNISQQQVLKVCSRDSLELVMIFRTYCDEFINVDASKWQWNVSSTSNDYHFRRKFDNALAMFPGDINEAAAAVNAGLPITSQSYATTPYLDFSIFNYDESFMSNIDRPIRCGPRTIQFLDRCTGITNFRVFLSQVDLIPDEGIVVLFIFHPYEPFFISLQKFDSYYLTNFHLYNSATIPKY